MTDDTICWNSGGAAVDTRTITIKGLLGQFDCEIDLTRKCNILVGANGFGKTSILKIIHCLGELDFVNLASIPFKQIEVQGDEPIRNEDVEEEIEFFETQVSYRIEYSDLFPRFQDIVEAIIRKLQMPEGLYGDDNHSIKELITSFFNALKKNNLFFLFLANIYFEKEQPSIVSELLIKHEWQSLTVSRNICSVTKQVLNEFLIEFSIGRAFKSPFLEKNVTLLNKTWYDAPKPVVKKSIVIDSSKFYTMNAERQKKSFIRIPVISHINELRSFFKEEFFIERPIEDEINRHTRVLYKELADIATKRHIQVNYNGALYSYEALLSPDIDDIGDIFIKKVVEDNLIDINMLIARFYYEDDFLLEFNIEAIKECHNLFSLLYKHRMDEERREEIRQYVGCPPQVDKNDGEIDKEEDDFDFEWLDTLVHESTFENNLIRDFVLDTEKVANLQNYFVPILSEDLILASDVKKMVGNAIRNIHDLELEDQVKYLVLYKFYERMAEDVLSDKHKSTRIKKFESLLREYLPDKAIVVMPSGLQISKAIQKTDSKGKFKLYRNIESFVNLNDLSSGEKKIIMLFALAILVGKGPLVLDEPEVSLSLVWQERLIPDILENLDSQVIVATHSPYIVSNDSLQESIIYLPER